MTTITIPPKLTKEKDLIIISRSEYEELLKCSRINEDREHLWESAAKNRFFESYSKSDSIYDQI